MTTLLIAHGHPPPHCEGLSALLVDITLAFVIFRFAASQVNLGSASYVISGFEFNSNMLVKSKSVNFSNVFCVFALGMLFLKRSKSRHWGSVLNTNFGPIAGFQQATSQRSFCGGCPAQCMRATKEHVKRTGVDRPAPIP